MSFHSRVRARSYFSINDISIASGPAAGVSFDDNIVRISENLCSELANGEVKRIVVTYSLFGRFGDEIPKTAMFNLSKTKNGPVISSHIVREPVMNNGMACFDLLSDCAE